MPGAVPGPSAVRGRVEVTTIKSLEPNMPIDWEEISRTMIQGASMMDARVVIITQRAEVEGGVLYQTITLKENPATQAENLSTAMVFAPTR
jgi:hypothetical protein